MKTIPSGMVQINKGGKLVISKGAASQVSRVGQQQVLVVSSGSGIRTVQTVSSTQNATIGTYVLYTPQVFLKTSLSCF